MIVNFWRVWKENNINEDKLEQILSKEHDYFKCESCDKFYCYDEYSFLMKMYLLLLLRWWRRRRILNSQIINNIKIESLNKNINFKKENLNYEKKK